MRYTTIRLTEKTVLKLKSLKKSLSETYEETILKLIKKYES